RSLPSGGRRSPIVGAGGVALDGDHGDRVGLVGVLSLAAGERRRRLAQLDGALLKGPGEQLLWIAGKVGLKSSEEVQVEILGPHFGMDERVASAHLIAGEMPLTIHANHGNPLVNIVAVGVEAQSRDG
ncbi:MAG TPA: hypothetical protein PLA92_00915, partial [Fimbriimonadaceae bacterium]|nr:hypothetical protein [Fimbriimonadaceae bacterium]